jgi:hypothetical protein
MRVHANCARANPEAPGWAEPLLKPIATAVRHIGHTSPLGFHPAFTGDARMRRILMLALLGLAPCTTMLTAQAPRSGEALVAAMHDRYAGKWYHTLTFTQRTVRPGRPDQTWYESAMIPGRLRIDFAPVDSGNASLYVGDSVYTFRGGQPRAPRADRNLLMTLGFDVYGQPAVTTIAQLRAEGIDLSKIRSDTWQGKPVWVVGAGAGDSLSNQFWVEQERLLFVRLLQQVPTRTGKALLEAQFNQYQPLGGGWIAMHVIASIDGKPVQEESYSDVKADVALPDSLYHTGAYTRPGWVH